ncbi:MAG TPA: hypothetical protein VIG47_05545 [Gemmatimonadaceae bacterium]|jgi:hypothetical protein
MDWTLRTCWKCNSAHEHLKSTPKLQCIACGAYYENGVEVGRAELSMLAVLEQTEMGQLFLKALRDAPQPEGKPLIVESLECTMTVHEYTKK